ncbi:thermostable hemolysin [Sphingomonas solaris]|uniref:Thermostable hemolysin n=1 Tax=Alterirhizorhabdus solaris TaxID=2529389 RepID=A0A558R500_9SPHN|nr:thermostable hemolysin [Sphingomonas solaris]TVV74461.1 hypothetical protein FOY91_09785 [Sphingomonas solaris]
MHHVASRSLVHRRYATVHGAAPAADYPDYLTTGASDAPQAVLGYRLARDERLFLEVYLDRPIEAVLTERLARPVARARIVELGDHASDSAPATVALWGQAAATLGAHADVAVAVLTKPLRAMLTRLGLGLVELAPARIEALGSHGARWGRYYETDPVICAGDIAACRNRLVAAGPA